MFRPLLVNMIALSILLSATNALGATLSGRLWESPGKKPVAGIKITIDKCGDIQSVTTSSSGSFRAQVANGICHLQVDRSNSPVIAIIVSGDSATANLELRKSGNEWRLIRR